MNNIENKKNITIFAIIYTFIWAAVILVAVFFQYKAYNRNYNRAVAQLCAVINEEYPDVSESKIAQILNNPDEIDNDKLTKSGEIFLQKYGIDMDNDAVILANKSELKRAVAADVVLVIFAVGGFLVVLLLQRAYYIRNIRQTTDYLRRINQGDYTLLMDDSKEGEFSILKSELYKTAIMMRESAENAKADKLLLKDSLSDISHQLKTPLTSLSINLENLEDNPDMDAATKEKLLRRAKRDVGNISQMVRAILKLSRLEADVVEFDEKQTKLADIVGAAAENVVALCDLKGIQLEIAKDCDADAKICCDAYWQTEAVTNIVKNAVEHAKSKVTIGYYTYDMYNEIIIDNDGATISDEDKNNIFKRFYRGQDSAADSIGIGLSLAESIIRHDNGYIMVDDLPGQKKECSGTRFVVRYL